jgi:hypothetical protein
MTLQERTKGGDPGSIVPVDGAITTETDRPVIAQSAAATVRCTLQPKNSSRSWAVGRATGRHHSVHGGQTKKNPCNQRRKGATGGGTPNTGYD